MSSYHIVGLDVSTSVVGYAILKHQPLLEIVECNYLKFPKAEPPPSLAEKWSVFQQLLGKLVGPEDEIFIEDFLQFAPGKSNANTITKLAHFSGMIHGSLLERGHLVTYLNVAHARSLVGVPNKVVPPFKDMKERCWHVLKERFGEHVPVWYTRTGTVRQETYDASDALIIGVAAHAVLYPPPQAEGTG